MARENARAKARRLLGEGRLVIVETRGRWVRAEVRSDSGDFLEVIHDAGSWTCPCAARGECSHILACRLVTAPVRMRRSES